MLVRIAYICFLVILAALEFPRILQGNNQHFWLYLTLSVIIFICAVIPLVILISRHSTPEDNSVNSERCIWIRKAVVCASIGLAMFALYSYLREIDMVPYSPYVADMLASIQFSLRKTFLGEGMYGLAWTPWLIPLGYLPMLTLSFAPAFLINIDIRFMAAVYYALLLFYLIARASKNIDTKYSFWAVIITVAFFAASRFVTDLFQLIHTPFFWLLICVFCGFVKDGKTLCSSLTLIGLLHTRESALVIVVPYFIYILRTMGVRKFLEHLAIVGVGYILVWIPFFDPKGLRALVIYKATVPFHVWEHGDLGWIINTFGFSNLIFMSGLASYLKFAIPAGLFSIYLVQILCRTCWNAAGFFSLSGLSLLWFYYFSGIPFRYIYIPVIIIWLFGLNALEFSLLKKVDYRNVLKKVAKLVSSSYILIYIYLFGMIAVFCFFIITEIQIPTKYVFANQKDNLISGFYQPEHTKERSFVWGSDKAQLFTFKLANIILEKELVVPFELNVAPFLCDPVARLTLSVFFNGHFVSNIILERGWQRVNFEAPAKHLRLGVNLCELRPSWSSSPKRCGLSEDERELSVAYSEMKIFIPKKPGFAEGHCNDFFKAVCEQYRPQ